MQSDPLGNQPLPAAAPESAPALQPMPERQRGPAGGPPEKSQTGWIVGGIVAAVAALAIGAFATGLISLPGSGPQTQAPVEIQQTQQAGSLITPFAANEMDRAINMLAVSEADRAAVRTQVTEGKIRIGWIMVADNQQEDGDWLSISGAGFKQDIRLFKNPIMVAIPYVPGTPVVVTGLVDGGGGGITAAVHVGGSPVLLKPLAPGESVAVPAP